MRAPSSEEEGTSEIDERFCCFLVPAVHGSERLVQDGTRVLVDATRVRPSPSKTILASRLAELAELLVQRGFIQFPDRIDQVDILERRFLSLPCVGKHDPFEVFRDRSTDGCAIYFRDRDLRDKPLVRCVRFEQPNSLLCTTQLSGGDIDEDEWTEIEDLGNSAIDSGDCLGDAITRQVRKHSFDDHSRPKWDIRNAIVRRL